MDTQVLEAFQKIVQNENRHLTERFNAEINGVLRAVETVSQDVKELEGRMRLLEISNSGVIAEIQGRIGQLVSKQVELEKDINVIGQRQQDWNKYYKAMEEEIVKYSKEVFLEKDEFLQKMAERDKADAEKWQEQSNINTTNKAIKAAVYVLAGAALSLIMATAWQIYLTGGIQNYAEYLMGK